MSLIEELEALRDRALSNLAGAWDYYHHTMAAWRVLEDLVQEGRPVRLENADTGTMIEGPALAKKAQVYSTDYLAGSVFQRFVSLLEDFTFGLIGAWLTAYPRGMGNLDPEDRAEKVDKSISIQVVLDNPDRESILKAIIERELFRVKYRKPAAWFAYLNKRAKLGVPSEDQLTQLVEIKSARDILEHNSGIINSTYVEKAGGAARWAVGDRLEISEPYLRDAYALINDLVAELSGAAMAKVA